MRSFVPSPEPRPDQISLELNAAGGKLSAMLRPPASAPEMLPFQEVPLRRAVKMAKLMADVLDTDVAIIDRLGIWHERLVTLALDPPAGEVPETADDEAGADTGGAAPRHVLHAPAT